MTIEKLIEKNRKLKYPWNIEVREQYIYCYNPLYMKKLNGHVMRGCTKTFLKEKNDYLDIMYKSILANQNLIIHEDCVEVFYDKNKSIKIKNP